jgi:hypothetical protein
MNERIRELAQQSGLISSFNSAPHRPDIEMFAKLIVLECMDISANIGEHGSIAAQEMRELFGVEDA